MAQGGGHGPGGGPRQGRDAGPAERPRSADLGRRFAARLIDCVIVQAVSMIALVPLLALLTVAGSALPDGPLSTGAGLGSFAALFFLIWWGYEVLFLPRWGATPGKRVMGLRVVPLHGAGLLLSTRAAAVRALFWAGPMLLGWSLWGNLLGGLYWIADIGWAVRDRPDRQALHDKAAGSRVVEEA
ncbi:RDD family protein [Nocardiopsis potens]|uniref:RDD family protein n=1 Tax=Nocardiopsis potens TaxID=1246458 RepID=UPI0003471C5E|nr:RDD family protein [Nocardiopsis potens]